MTAGTAHLRAPGEALLRVEHLVVTFPAGRGRTVHAVSDVSFDVLPGETLGIVGESGCGKSSMGRAAVLMPPPASGSVVFEGRDLTGLRGEELRRTRRRIQMIFQDPISSLNPRRRVGDIVTEPMAIWNEGGPRERAARAREVFEAVGLDYDAVAGRRPHEFSGGQCQRISIARALVLDPKLLICDEPVSALDVSVQAQILNLLEDAKARFGLSLVFIAHDLGVVKNVSDRVAVMYLGRLCEVAPAEELYRAPAHPYTRALLDAVPVPDPAARPAGSDPALAGEFPSPLAPPSGCRFRTRCPLATGRCATEEPQLREVRPGRHVACHHA
ncbi:peptide ABC transporter ATP-binding protein [Spongiactinospora rosea]|uniref:Peptide ABC transporter ATP-binding protein n=1 Tax=Spongiactinospora rosea TaxID=2248750 RepID=A0A366LWI3_9ACTN|nr:oligopeptide/dipeptide ABC transporter ATP-binding protein [Spongiactinospora rosea]RBQ18281.1 peptide ABC transporter ATP-binding protein [Spongiactinospora rosea]